MNFRKQDKDGKFGSIMIDFVSFEDAMVFEDITRQYFTDKNGKFKFKDSFSFMLSLVKAEIKKREVLSKCAIKQKSG